ncbi:uncharacterized protein LOC123896640 [Trifolium pratense]|uniref:uncharacterized protein LOC123896640 n=1 Tax=Trifolium pratense TaxID=57577 RepID=UPI001E6935BA|nr:uncharacterized protein LOC123896640 [Trifolium pratense]
MENKSELLIKRGKGGCPTRLQKHAPASLDIHMVLNERPSNPFGDPSRAIPLLSPLILSPKPLIYADIALQALKSEDSIDEGSSSSSSSTPGSKGWEHPAIASYPSPSSLCSFFQNQCVFVNNAQ